MQPLVSIITIFLNAEEYIEEAIASAIAQSYDAWELLLVDDGSTDRSSKIARAYAAQYPEKIRYLEHPGHENLGMSASRNLGIQHAQGDYIAFLDADDVYLPHKIAQQVAILESHPEAALVCGRTKWWYSWTGNEGDRPPDFIQKYALPLNAIVSPPAILILFLQDEWASLCDILVRRQAVKTVGGYETSFRGMYEDQAFHAKLCLKYPAFVASECWYLYRQHPQACTNDSHMSGKTLAARQTFLTWLEDYLSRTGLEQTEVWRVVQRQLFPYRHPHLHRLWLKWRFGIWGRGQKVATRILGRLAPTDA
jgi:glycosyltransferase involved in cell wall biosynthesis